MSLTFRAVEAADIPLLNAWLSRPHVAAWWDADEPFAADDLADPQTTMLLSALDGSAFAYVQHYRIHGFGQHVLDFLPTGARGIDQFIGEPDLLGRGHGTALVKAVTAHLFAAGAPAVGVDPHPENGRAIRAYEKAGFTREGLPRESPWGLVQPLACRPSR